MPNPNISAALTDADIKAIADAAAIIKSKLPFAVRLQPDERQALQKLGQGTLGFVQDALDGAQAHPEMLPATFDVAEFAKDSALFDNMLKVLAVVQPLSETVEHTTMLVGSEAFAAARLVYEYAKTAAKTTPGLQSLVDRLAERFKQTRTGRAQGQKPQG